MMSTLPTPEICYPNFADVLLYPLRLIDSSSSLWVTDTIQYLYDHRSDLQCVTSCSASDNITSSIRIDLFSAQYIGLIKILNTNAKNLKIEYSSDNTNWTTLVNPTNLTSSYYNVEVTSTTPNKIDCTVTYNFDGSDNIIAGSGTSYFLHYRYWRISIKETQIANEEKKIGEIYLGRRVFKLIANRFKQSFEDNKEQTIRLWDGTPIVNTVRPLYTAEMTILRPDATTLFLIKALIKHKNNYDFFPTATTNAADKVSFDLSGDDIYLVQSKGTWHHTAWGMSPSSQVDFLVQETKFVY